MTKPPDVLKGEKLEEVRASPDHRSLSITAGGTVVFRADPDEECALRTERADEPIEGEGIFEDGKGRKIVRVKTHDEQVSLHLEDGEIFHVLAVVNEDGCRIATREEREHGSGKSSLVDRALGKLR